MSWGAERLEQLKFKAVDLVPVAKTLQLGGLDDWSPGRVVKRWMPSADVLNADGSMFGGHIAALADQMLAFAVMSVLADGLAFRTVNLAVQFFKVGHAHPLLIESRVTAQSRSLIATEADFCREDGVLIARASAQQMLIPIPNAG